MAEIPKQLGKYEIRGELGRGAMGVVYEGWDPAIGRRVALKTVRKDQLDGSEAEQILSRFKREAQAAGRLNHPNVVAVYEYGEDSDGTAFIAMEYVEGRELKDFFDRQERFPLSEAVRLMDELLAALAHAHAHGIVHRDVKPANFFVLADGRAKIGDFGIARIESSNLTQVGSVLGTPAYMSPEQFMGQPVDGRSDLFSAGVILYQFLTGEKPFAGQLTTIMHKVLREDPIAPSELNVQVPPAFDALVRKALAKRPEERFQSAAEFAAALRSAPLPGSAAADPTVLATLPGKPSAPPLPPAAEKAVQPAVRLEARPGRRLPVPAIAAAIAVLFAAGGLVLYGGKKPQPAAEAVQPVAAGASLAESDESPRVVAISAVGLADSSDPRFAADPSLLRASLREETRRELIEKAVALYVESASLADHYAILRDRLLARAGDFIDAVLLEEAPQTGKDGLVSMRARAMVRVREVQKSLNQMSRDERIDFIRNNGDPRIAVAIATVGTEAGAQPQRSQVAENVLKERIQSFGFRTWNEEGTGQKADFSVRGEARFKKLSVRLEASGLQIERAVLTSWTIKCQDNKSGEEIYFNTNVPARTSWNSEEEALADIGRMIGEEFSKNFFLQHFHFAARKLHLDLKGLPDEAAARRVAAELSGLRAVLAAEPGRDPAGIDLQLAGGLGDPANLVTVAIAQPLNRKFGRSCFSIGSASGNTVTLEFDPACREPGIFDRLDSAPPAALYQAPTAKRHAIVKNPDLLRKLEI